MGLGLDLEVKNSRYHTPLDLTANKEIKAIIYKALDTKNCSTCNRLFDFHHHQIICKICLNVFCEKCTISDYYFEKLTDTEKDILECRCHNCYNDIKNNENNLINAIRNNELTELIQSLDKIKINKVKIDLKLFAEAEREITRLETEKKIQEYVESLKKVENFKTINKSVSVLDDLIVIAGKNGIIIDDVVINRVLSNKKRLIAEKELR